MTLKLAISFRSGCISLVSSPDSFHLQRGEGQHVSGRWLVLRTFGDRGGNLFESNRRCQWSPYASGGWTSSCVRCEASCLPAKSTVSSYRICTIGMAAFKLAPHTISTYHCAGGISLILWRICCEVGLCRAGAASYYRGKSLKSTFTHLDTEEALSAGL